MLRDLAFLTLGSPVYHAVTEKAETYTVMCLAVSHMSYMMHCWLLLNCESTETPQDLQVTEDHEGDTYCTLNAKLCVDVADYICERIAIFR